MPSNDSKLNGSQQVNSSPDKIDSLITDQKSGIKLDQKKVNELVNPAPNRPNRIIFTIFGIALLLLGIAAGVLLVQRQQQVREKAANASQCSQTNNCVLLDSPGNSGTYTTDKDIDYVNISSQETFKYTSGDNNDGCYHVAVAGKTVTWDKVGQGPICKDISNIQIWQLQNQTWLTGWSGTLGDNKAVCIYSPQYITVNGHVDIQPSGAKAYLQTNWKVVLPDKNATCPSGDSNCTQDHFQTKQINGSTDFTIQGWWPGVKPGDKSAEVHFGVNLLDEHGNTIHDGVGVDQYWYPWVCPAPSVTLTPTPTQGISPSPSPSIEATCLDVKAYDKDWKLLTSEQLSTLKSGDIVRFAVMGTTNSGYFDKARFTINGVQRPEVTQKINGTDQFYDEYTIPSGTTTFSVSAQLHHSVLGWF